MNLHIGIKVLKLNKLLLYYLLGGVGGGGGTFAAEAVVGGTAGDACPFSF
jgi:hypothetical protein